MKRLDLQLDFVACFVEFAGAQIHFENAKPYNARGAARRRHGIPPACDDYNTPLENHDWGSSMD
jgi:hypothetical protein